MARIIMEFSPEVTRKVIDEFNVDTCTKISDASAVSFSEMTMTEISPGIYIIDNQHITSDTFIKMSLIGTDNYATGIFSMSDDNIARQDALSTLGGLTLPELTDQRIHLLDNLANLDAKISSVVSGKVFIPMSNKQNYNTNDIVSNGGNSVTYRDGSQLIIGS